MLLCFQNNDVTLKVSVVVGWSYSLVTMSCDMNDFCDPLSNKTFMLAAVPFAATKAMTIFRRHGNGIVVLVLLVVMLTGVKVRSFPHLRGLQLANPISNQQDFTIITRWIGADHYWAFVQDYIVRGDGSTAQQSQLGYLLSRPLLQKPSNLTTIMLAITSIGPQDDSAIYKS